MIKDLKCVFLNHGNPYLKLAPFKFEFLSFGPEVGYVHDFVSQTEIKEIKKDARGKMKTTPYDADGTYGQYSRWRTSKVMYINERLNKNAMKISKNIERVTNTVLSRAKYDSENFQVNKLLCTY